MNITIIKKVLGNNIKCLKKKNVLTQEELTEKCNLSDRYIIYIENKKVNISVDTLEKLTQNLNVE